MDDATQKFKATLKKNGLSVTMSRKIVFNALQGQEPQTMAELVEACWRHIDRATVYRTVELFERLGMVKRLQIGWKHKLELSDDFQHHHHHLTCRVCGRTTPLPEDQALESRLKLLAAAEGFTMQDHQVEIQGVCSNCH